MLLEAIEVDNFRNLGGGLACGKGLNILVGENGQGKTNWLEAINVLATARSFKTAKISEVIRFGEDLAIIRGPVRRSEEIHRNLQVAIQNNIKTLSVNGKRERAQGYLGELHAVVFNSDELAVVRGLPENRRRFLDNGIISLHPPFVRTFSEFGRVIRQKNALLLAARDNEYSVEKTAELLLPWNEQLASLAVRIHKGRLRFIERINEVLEKRLFGREELSIRYVSSLEGKGDLSAYESLITERLSLRVQAELVAGHSLIGPHRDDLEILFDGHDIRKYGSAGQQRSAFLLLQLANMSVFHATHAEYPLFLLDDIDAELDHRRIGQLLEFLQGRAQTFVTTSKEGFVSEFGASARVFGIRDGTAQPLVNAAH
jgi:DNA replication and repair protein RecF